MNAEKISERFRKRFILALLLTLGMANNASSTSLTLEGLNKGDTNTWVAGNLQNWQELDYIPCRVHWSGAQGNNQVVEIDFPHRTTGIPGFQDLFNFSTSANV